MVLNKPKGIFNKLKYLALAVFATLAMAGCSDKYIVLHPVGPVAQKEYHLIVLSTIICAIVVIPVIALLIFIIFRYRDTPGNKAPYTPNWSESKLLETIWWGIPIVIVVILGVITVRDTYSLSKEPVHAKKAKPLTIQVTSLDWKWLFIYPDQKIATVNYAEIPAGVPVQFELTSDAPMNSFWVPQLGGQEYTMPGMKMRLWLEADKKGTYFGSGANFSGEGFAHMQFKVTSTNQTDFNTWVKGVKQSSPALTQSGYNHLAEKGLAKVQSFSSVPNGLFDKIVEKNGHHMTGDMKNEYPKMKQKDDMSGMDMKH
jgi:cytochrome aa3-600 menaquinol oxidase subunit 2